MSKEEYEHRCKEAQTLAGIVCQKSNVQKLPHLL